MTQEEYENQEEFFEEVLSTKQKVLKYSLFSIAIVVVIALISSLFILNGDETVPNGYIVVEIPEDRGHLYVDQNLEVGFEPNVPYPVETGKREVTILLPGYKTVPAMQSVEIGRDDTVRLSFRFEEERMRNAGIVRSDGGLMRDFTHLLAQIRFAALINNWDQEHDTGAFRTDTAPQSKDHQTFIFWHNTNCRSQQDDRQNDNCTDQADQETAYSLNLPQNRIQHHSPPCEYQGKSGIRIPDFQL